MNFSINKTLILFLILIIGVVFRLYNVTFDNLWYDEIISFWVANPNNTFSETKVFHDQIETTSIVYNLILKTHFAIFGYDVLTGRLLSSFFGIFGIISIIYIDRSLNKKNNAYLFSSFLVSTNIFLIGYSQELRNYTLWFFITSLSLFFFIKVIQNDKKRIYLLILLPILLFNVLIHPFGLIIFFAMSFYLFLELVFKKNFCINTAIIFLIIFLISVFYYYNLFSITTTTDSDYYWFMKNPSLSFYSNFHFSNYFGSRLVGGVFLICFLYLIINNFRELIKISHLRLFLIVVVFSYLLPIVFGYLFKPMLLPRHTLWNLVPISLLFSSLLFNFEKKKIRYVIIFLLSFLTIGNHFTEKTIQQFYQDRKPYKPEYNKAIDYIFNSGINKYSIKIEKMKSDEASLLAIANYVNHINKELTLIRLDQPINDKSFWFLCPLDINNNCELPKNIKENSKILSEKQFNSIVLRLIKLNKTN